MSDLIDGGGAGPAKHGEARSLVESALRARREGDDARAEMLMEQARRTDPAAVEDVLMELEPGETAPGDQDEVTGSAADREVAAISREVQPGADAPSRAGITGSGSGADSEGL